MATDQIIELMELMEEDPAWLPEFYSAVANSEMVVPMILPPGRVEPVPVWANRHTSDSIVFDPDLNDYVPYRASSIDSNWYCLLYSNPDAYKSVKPILEAKYKKLGHIVDPIMRNGRQVINIFCKSKYCAAINLFTSKSPQYLLSYEQMEIIRRRPVTAKPKALPEKEKPARDSKCDAHLIHGFYLEKIEKLERGNRELQAHLCKSLKENAELEAEMKAKLTGCERQIAELQANLAAFQDFSVPVAVREAVENAARRFSSRLVIHPRVNDIIEAWPYRKKSRCVAHTVKMLEAVARTLYEMKFESQDGYIDPLQFQAITGYELAMTEGRQTKRNQHLDGLRYCRHEDRTVIIYAHLKKRIEANLHMRIYIGFLEDERKILIGQVGPHMPNSQTANL